MALMSYFERIVRIHQDLGKKSRFDGIGWNLAGFRDLIGISLHLEKYHQLSSRVELIPIEM